MTSPRLSGRHARKARRVLPPDVEALLHALRREREAWADYASRYDSMAPRAEGETLATVRRELHDHELAVDVALARHGRGEGTISELVLAVAGARGAIARALTAAEGA